MAGSHVLRAPEGGVYRVSRSIDVFAFHAPQPLPRPAAGPIEDGNRWDDAEGKFATVYCASQVEAAFGEVIARYRERPGLLARIDDFLTQSPDAEYDPLLSPGVVPREFFDGRWVGHVPVDSAVRFVDVDDPATHAAVDVTLRRTLREYGVKRVDRGTFLTSDRRVTRTIVSRYHWLAQTPDHASWRGLRYLSRLAPDWECWAIWEPSPLLTSRLVVEKVTREHSALQAAAQRLNVRV
jgi:RES domain